MLEANFQSILIRLPLYVWRPCTKLWKTPWMWLVMVPDGSWFRTDSEVLLPLLVDEHSMWGDFVRPATTQVIQVYMSTDVHGDDRFSPGVTDCVSLDRQKDLDSHGEEHWERLFLAGIVLWPVCRTGGVFWIALLRSFIILVFVIMG